MNLQFLSSPNRVLLGNLTRQETAELCRLLTGSTLCLTNGMEDMRLQVLLLSLVCIVNCLQNELNKERDKFQKQLEQINSLSCEETYKLILCGEEKVQQWLERVECLTTFWETLVEEQQLSQDIVMVNGTAKKELLALFSERRDDIQSNYEENIQRLVQLRKQLKEWKHKLEHMLEAYDVGNVAFDGRQWSMDLFATLLSTSFAIYGMFAQFFGYYVQLPIYNMGNASQYYFYGIVGGISICLLATIYFSFRWFLRVFRSVFFWDYPFSVTAIDKPICC
eukprot:jgi/Galph1/1837/GphlegSOOS_G505.1